MAHQSYKKRKLSQQGQTDGTMRILGFLACADADEADHVRGALLLTVEWSAKRFLQLASQPCFLQG